MVGILLTITLVLFVVLAAVVGIATVKDGVLARAALDVPLVYANIKAGAEGQLVFQAEGGKPFALRERPPPLPAPRSAGVR